MFVTEKSPSVIHNTIGVECELNYSIPMGLQDLWAFSLLQTYNPERDFQRISFYYYFQIVPNMHFFHSNNKPILKISIRLLSNLSITLPKVRNLRKGLNKVSCFLHLIFQLATVLLPHY